MNHNSNYLTHTVLLAITKYLNFLQIVLHSLLLFMLVCQHCFPSNLSYQTESIIPILYLIFIHSPISTVDFHISPSLIFSMYCEIFEYFMQWYLHSSIKQFGQLYCYLQFVLLQIEILLIKMDRANNAEM